jgi:membrane associated rhomboid family serine protease
VRARQWNATRGTLLVTYTLIVVNLAVAVYVASSDPIGRGVNEGEWQLSLNRYFIDSGEWWRIVTSGFLHFGFAHLAMNMFSLFVLGRVLEPVMAKWAFFALYMTSLLAGSAGVLVMESGVQITGGASGAIFGLLGATAIALHQRGIGLMQSGIGMALLLNLVITFSIPGISIGGHVGGLIGGAVCGYVMLAPRGRYPRWAVWATPLVVSAVAVAVCFAVSAGTIPT